MVVTKALNLGSQRHVQGYLLVAFAMGASMLDGSLVLVVVLAWNMVVG